MAVTPSTVAELNDIAKDYYTSYWAPQMAKGTPLKAQFDQLENWEFAGRKIIFGMKLETGGGVSNAGANKTLPGNADGTYDQGEVTLKRTYARMAIDMFAAEISKRSKGSYKPFLSEKMDDRMKAMQKEVNRQLYSDGSGKLAMTASGTASATQTLSLAYGVTNGGQPAKFIYKGDQLAFYDNAGVLIGRRTVSSKSATLGAATNTVTLNSTITSVSNGWVARSTDDDDNYTTGEVSGLLAGVAQSGTFQNVTIAGTYQALKLSNSGTLRDISDSVVMTGFTSCLALSDEVPNLLVTRPGIVQKYSEVFLPIRRIDGQEATLKGGFKPLSVFQHAAGEAPILQDPDCPGARVFGINTNYVKKIDAVGDEWFNMDGAEVRAVNDKDAVEGYVRKYWQMAWLKLNCHFVIEDINDVATADRTHS